MAGVVSFIYGPLSSSSFVDCASKDRVRAVSRIRSHDLHHFGASAVVAGVAAKQRDAGRKAQRSVAVIEERLPRREAAEQPRFVPILIEKDVRPRKARGGREDVRLLPPRFEIAR